MQHPTGRGGDDILIFEQIMSSLIDRQSKLRLFNMAFHMVNKPSLFLSSQTTRLIIATQLYMDYIHIGGKTIAS